MTDCEDVDLVAVKPIDDTVISNEDLSLVSGNSGDLSLG
jgi:hypothetical protein